MEINDPKLDAIVSKLRKLQSLYEGAKKINSEGEAAAAAAAIQRLLTQYNLTMEQVGEEPEKNPMMQKQVSGYTYKSIGGFWEQRLVSVLCEFNYCRCFIYGSSYKRLLIVGKKENIEMVEWLRNMLSERYVAFSKAEYKSYVNSMPSAAPKMSIDKFQRSFLVGCADGLKRKFQEEKIAERQKDVNYSNQVVALVTRNSAAIDEYVAKAFGKVGTTNRGNKVGSYSAYGSGVQEGRRTQIHKPVTGTTKTSPAGLI